jgi:hypothetical protein
MGIDWFVLIIPAIAIGIWAFRNVIERSNEANRNLPPPGRPAAQRPRSATAEIDRFLEEVNRRRQMQQQRQTQTRRTQEPVTLEAVEVMPAPSAPRARPVAARPRPAAQPPVRRPVVQPEIVIAAVAQPPSMDATPTSSTSARFETAPIAAVVTRPLSPHLQQLRKLLVTAAGLRNAFILNELLGTPRCRRPHRRA